MTRLCIEGWAGRLGWVVAAALLVFPSLASGQAAGLVPSGLRCEYLTEPLGLGEALPRLSWVLESEGRGKRQSAYRLLVASSAEGLAADRGDLWDSGRVESDATAQVVYGGAALRSRQRCYWKVRSWDETGAEGPWSGPAVWEMGLLEPGEWTAQWVDAAPVSERVEVVRATYATADGAVSADVTQAVKRAVEAGGAIVATNEALGGDPAYGTVKRLRVEYVRHGAAHTLEIAEKGSASFSRLPLLRKDFELKAGVTAARLYVTALGVYEVTLNGERVGDQHFAPGWTDYRERVYFQTYDVTGLLSEGANTLGAIVGPGWFCGRAGLFHARQFYGEAPALLAQLEIAYADGKVERVVTDGTWIQRAGPILQADMMEGETHDARLEVAGWNRPGATVDEWTPVRTRMEERHLEATPDHPVRELERLAAQSVTEPQPGRYTFDLGQNMVGVVELSVRAPAGTVLTIRHGELLNPDGTIYTANLRGAPSTDTYICSGTGMETWRPRFTFHGFRYVEVTGLTERPSVGAVTGIVLGSDLPEAGSFSCSEPALNRLQSNIIWGQRGNYLSVPTDCPQRDERMGWMADTQVFVPTAAFNADIAPFMTKWMVDVADAQREDGAHSDVAPVMKGLTYGTPAWADAGTIVPWAIYTTYGDTRILERHIDSMIAWVEWCRGHSEGLIRTKDRGNDYGDWLSIGADTPKDLIGTAYFARSAWIVARSLRVLGRSAEADSYDGLFREICAAFNGRYVDGEGRIAGDTQCGYVLALAFDLLPEGLRARAAAHLVADIRAKGDHLSTGFVGVSMLLPVLTEAGRADIAYRLLLQDTFPSWLYSVRQGATTIWERWDGATEKGPHPDIGMNSFNHYALGSCGEWFYSGIGGIRAEEPGFSKVTIRPCFEGPLSWAKASHRSIRGTIATEWERAADSLRLVVVIPANASATLELPAAAADIRESGRTLGEAEGCVVQERCDNGTRLGLGSGRYSFAFPAPAREVVNPVVSGWYADPEVAEFDGVYWIYPTTSAPYDAQTWFDAFSSPDLKRWTKHPRVLERASVPWAMRAMWAPSVVRNNGKYYFFFSANDIQSNDQVGGIGVAVSDSPSGPFKDLLGRPLIDAFHHGAQPIDQFAFLDPSGQWYLLYGGWRHCNITRLDSSFAELRPFDDGELFKEITPPGYVEGPFMFVRDGTYYFMWSEGGWTGPDYSVAYATGPSPLGPFTKRGTILRQDPTIGTGAGHHSVVHDEKRDEWHIVYHRRPLGAVNPNHRVVCIDRLVFAADGTIEPVKMTGDRANP